MARRGFFAQLQHQVRQQARERERAERASAREHQAAVRLAEMARKTAQRHQEQLDRATAAEKKVAEKQARDALIAAKEAEVEELNKRLADDYAEIDSILASTLARDDFVDLESLRVTVSHPPFSRPELESPLPLPKEIHAPQAPVFVPPEPPKGLAAFFRKRKYEALVLSEHEAHKRALEEHEKLRQELANQRNATMAAYEAAERERLASLELARTSYERSCRKREIEATEQNQRLDELIANLGYGAVDAVQEYVSIVLANSVYPECFPVSHDFSFDPAAAELRLHVLVPGPDKVPTTKAFKYTKSSNEITEIAQPQKAIRDRYEGAVYQVALRSLHEIFEADRRAIIKTISLTVGTEAVDPATGRMTSMPFVVVGVDRDKFLEIELSAVVPAATLSHLGAALSKNPYALIVADPAGVRRS